jgi:hypothetical protein
MNVLFPSINLRFETLSANRKRQAKAVMPSLLKIQASGAGPLSQGTHPTMILVSSSVEDDFLDSLRFGSSGQGFTYNPGLLRFGETRDIIPNLFVQSGGSHQGTPFGVVNYLRIDMFQAAKDGQPRTILAGFYSLTYPQMSPTPSHVSAQFLAHSLCS